MLPLQPSLLSPLVSRANHGSLPYLQSGQGLQSLLRQVWDKWYGRDTVQCEDFMGRSG